MARANAAQRRKLQQAARKRRATSLKITRGVGGGQGNRHRKTSSARAGQNPERNFPATKPGQSVYREEQEARRKAGKSYNPNNKARKPSVEPGTNRLSRSIRAKERAEQKAAAERAAKRRQQKTRVKPAKPAAKSSKPNPRMTGEGAPRPSADSSSSIVKEISRLAEALADKKGMKSYMDRLRKKNKK